jgi:hypothetical protein
MRPRLENIDDQWQYVRDKSQDYERYFSSLAAALKADSKYRTPEYLSVIVNELPLLAALKEVEHLEFQTELFELLLHSEFATNDNLRYDVENDRLLVIDTFFTGWIEKLKLTVPELTTILNSVAKPLTPELLDVIVNCSLLRKALEGVDLQAMKVEFFRILLNTYLFEEASPELYLQDWVRRLHLTLEDLADSILYLEDDFMEQYSDPKALLQRLLDVFPDVPTFERYSDGYIAEHPFTLALLKKWPEDSEVPKIEHFLLTEYHVPCLEAAANHAATDLEGLTLETQTPEYLEAVLGILKNYSFILPNAKKFIQKYRDCTFVLSEKLFNWDEIYEEILDSISMEPKPLDYAFVAEIFINKMNLKETLEIAALKFGLSRKRALETLLNGVEMKAMNLEATLEALLPYRELMQELEIVPKVRNEDTLGLMLMFLGLESELID